MPAHDWTRVAAGTFHDFHVGWIAELRRVLNSGLLPPAYYAQAEGPAGDIVPNVLALERQDATADDGLGGVALASAPPRLSVTRAADSAAAYAVRRRTLAIRHKSGDRVVALVEIVSPGNKDRAASVEAFVDKAVAATRAGVHLMIVDLFPPRRHDPGGLCNAALEAMGGEPFPLPAERHLAVAAFRVGSPGVVDCYAEPLGVGAPLLPDVPLFFDADHYVNVPIEATYDAAWQATPRRWRDVITHPH